MCRWTLSSRQSATKMGDANNAKGEARRASSWFRAPLPTSSGQRSQQVQKSSRVESRTLSSRQSATKMADANNAKGEARRASSWFRALLPTSSGQRSQQVQKSSRVESRTLSSAGSERRPYKAEVAGSIPAASTKLTHLF